MVDAKLSKLKMTVGHAHCVSDWLKKTTCLRSLDISENPEVLGRIGGDLGAGLKAIADGLIQNTTLTTLVMKNVR